MTRQTSSAEQAPTENVLHGESEPGSGVFRAAPPSSFEIPFVPELEHAPRRLDAADERDLRWWLANPHVASLAEGSGIGAALERASLLGYGALPCRRCGGRWKKKWRKRDGTTVIVEWRDGTGREPRRRGKRETYAQALRRYRHDECRRLGLVLVARHPDDESTRDAVDDAFSRRGETAVTAEELKAAYPTLPDELTKECGSCKGLGVVPRREGRQGEITARPMGSSVRLGGREGLSADDMVDAIGDSVFGVLDGSAYVALAELERYRGVEQTLRDVATLSPLARVALEGYYGDQDGTERPSGWTALQELTPTFNEPEGRVRVQREPLIARQAADLYDHACQAYNVAAYGVDW